MGIPSLAWERCLSRLGDGERLRSSGLEGHGADRSARSVRNVHRRRSDARGAGRPGHRDHPSSVHLWRLRERPRRMVVAARACSRDLEHHSVLARSAFLPGTQLRRVASGPGRGSSADPSRIPRRPHHRHSEPERRFHTWSRAEHGIRRARCHGPPGCVGCRHILRSASDRASQPRRAVGAHADRGRRGSLVRQHSDPGLVCRAISRVLRPFPGRGERL